MVHGVSATLEREFVMSYIAQGLVNICDMIAVFVSCIL